MEDPFFPGSERAGDLFTPQALVDAMVAVEAAWLGTDLDAVDIGELASFEAGGNPVIALVTHLRETTGNSSIHVGLTSQDVLDTALMLLARDTARTVSHSLRWLSVSLVALARDHRDTPVLGRTLTQPAVPRTFGLKVADWLSALLDAYDDLTRLTFPLQLGGAAGTNAAIVQLGRRPQLERDRIAASLGLTSAVPWHTARRPVTRIGDTLVAVNDSLGRMANDVLVMSRAEVGELAEGTPGGSSTMPGKSNPVMSLLVRRSAITAPHLGAVLHASSALQVDDRADGAWHAEWAVLRDLARLTAVTASQGRDMIANLVVHADRMRQNLEAVGEAAVAEQQTMAQHANTSPTRRYLGEADDLIDAALARAAAI